MSRKNKKQIETVVKIERFSFPNYGIGYFEGKKVKIKNGMIGQEILVRLKKTRRNLEGNILEIKKYSNKEIKPLCTDFKFCGGCTFQNIPYYYELELKKNMVEEILSTTINYNKKIKINEAPKIKAYRNKMEYSFGDTEKNGELALGLRKRNSFYEVVITKNCNIVDSDFIKILSETLNHFKKTNENFYHKRDRVGSLRHLVIRKGEFTGEIFVNLITTSNFNSNIKDFSKVLEGLKLKGKIVGIAHTLNDSIGDVVQSDSFNLIHGRDYFYDELLGLKFKISPFSFFQTNSAGAEKLYSIVKDFIGDNKDKIIFDLYCGTGTIAQIVSQNAKKVIGIELVEEAVLKAKENAKLNNINNCEFISEDVLTGIDKLNDKPNIIILDPPRDGVHEKALKKIIKFNAEKIIYVSCKPSSLGRDLKILLENNYLIEKIECQDMFPKTYHIETVVLLTRENKV